MASAAASARRRAERRYVIHAHTGGVRVVRGPFISPAICRHAERASTSHAVLYDVAALSAPACSPLTAAHCWLASGCSGGNQVSLDALELNMYALTEASCIAMHRYDGNVSELLFNPTPTAVAQATCSCVHAAPCRCVADACGQSQPRNVVFVFPKLRIKFIPFGASVSSTCS